jgi:hypothetical protein
MEPGDFLTDHRSTVDLRIFFSAAEYNEYTAELSECEPSAPHVGTPPVGARWPLVVGSALMDGHWVHSFLRLDYLRDYFVSLLFPTSSGSTLKEIKERTKPRPAAPAPRVEPEPTVRIEIDD